MVIVVLGEFLERVIVALRAPDATAKKSLRHSISDFRFLGFFFAHESYVVADLGTCDAIARCGQDLPDQLVPRTVGCYLFAQPA